MRNDILTHPVGAGGGGRRGCEKWGVKPRFRSMDGKEPKTSLYGCLEHFADMIPID